MFEGDVEGVEGFGEGFSFYVWVCPVSEGTSH